MHNEEERLVLRAKQRDAEAFGELYELYFDKIYRYAAFKVRDATEAEDIAEQVFLKAWEAIGSYDLRGLPFAAWLFRIARNAAIDQLRQKSRRQTVLLPEGFESALPDPMAIIESNLTREQLLQAMQCLTEGQRQAIALRFGGGLSLIEAAAVMGRSEGAIKALQHSGVVALRRLLVKEK